MRVIVIAMILYCIAYIHDFPGGPTGFADATMNWLGRLKKKLKFS